MREYQKKEVLRLWGTGSCSVRDIAQIVGAAPKEVREFLRARNNRKSTPANSQVLAEREARQELLAEGCDPRHVDALFPPEDSESSS